MILRLRRYVRGESVGVGVAVSFAMLYALWQLLQATIGGAVYPIVLHLFGKDDLTKGYRLDFTRLGIHFDVSGLFIDGLAFSLMAGLVYLLFIRPIDDEGDVEPGMRECPECKSEIVIDATRCAFCTTVVTPLTEQNFEEVTP